MMGKILAWTGTALVVALVLCVITLMVTGAIWMVFKLVRNIRGGGRRYDRT